MRVSAEGDKGGETRYAGCVRCTCAAHDDGNTSTLVHGHFCLITLARGCIYRELVVRCGRGCGTCSISIALSKLF
jgi:hypothetical protein